MHCARNLRVSYLLVYNWPRRRQMVSTMLACGADEQMPKSLFWAPSCVPGCEHVPWLACKMSLWNDIRLTDLWILWEPGTTEDISAANFLFVNGRCHLENFWPVIESDSIKRKKITTGQDQTRARTRSFRMLLFTIFFHTTTLSHVPNHLTYTSISTWPSTSFFLQLFKNVLFPLLGIYYFSKIQLVSGLFSMLRSDWLSCY